MWQFWHLGCWNTWRTVSNAATASTSSSESASGAQEASEIASTAPTAHLRRMVASSGWQGERKLPETLSGQRRDRVGHRRGDRGHAHLTDSSRFFGARHDMDLDDRHLVHPQHPVVVVIRFFHTARFEVQIAVECRAQPEDD